jgi:hypothetical protein
MNSRAAAEQGHAVAQKAQDSSFRGNTPSTTPLPPSVAQPREENRCFAWRG